MGMKHVYLFYEIIDYQQYSVVVAASKEVVTAIANDYIRIVKNNTDWKDKTYEEFEDVVDVNGAESYRIEELPLYEDIPGKERYFGN